MSEQIVNMYSKQYDECKYQLFTKYRYKKHGIMDIDDFIVDYEEEKKLAGISTNADLSNKQSAEQAGKVESLAANPE